MNNNPIGIFDSGVGGLSILLEVKKLLPKETFFYLADQEYMPYGGKTTEELIKRTDKIASFLVSRQVKAIVVACNTATIAAIDTLRQRYKVPIIGTVPVIKTIASATKTKNIAVFSTPSTSKSTYLDDLIQKFAPEMTVYRIGETSLEHFIEEGEIEGPQIEAVLKKELVPLVSAGVDAIALGCTHYPFVKEQIIKIVGNAVTVCDSGGAVARRLSQVLEHEGLLALQKGIDRYYTTGDEGKFKRVASKLLQEEIVQLNSLI